jgi:hypothetical protein
MIQANINTTLDGSRYVIVVLDEEERKLVESLRRYADKATNWTEYRNYYIKKVGKFYESRGLSRQEVVETPAWKIAEGICGRLQVAAGEAEESDYRDELELLIQTKFGSRREFCKATGLSEDMLSHVLAGRKNFSIDKLGDALAKIGYTFHISPLTET